MLSCTYILVLFEEDTWLYKRFDQAIEHNGNISLATLSHYIPIWLAIAS